jgi:hypothetical protein
MDRITRKHLVNPLKKGVKREYYEREYVIFTQKEADKNKIKYKHWRECNPGDYGISDDGYVSVCLKRREYKKGVNLVFPFGQAFSSTKSKFEYLPRRETGNFSNIGHKSWMDQNKTRTQYRNFAKAYAIQFAAGSIDYEQLGRVFSADERMPAVKARLLLKKPYVREMVEEELQKILTDGGITKEKVVEMLKSSFTKAEELDQPSNMLRAAENFMDIYGMKAKDQPKGTMEAEIVSLSEIERSIQIEDAQVEVLSE